MNIRPSIQRDSVSYRQGLILGLTMAETLLLLIFCLMLGLITYLQQAEEQRDKAQQSAETLSLELASIKERNDKLERRFSQEKPELVIDPAIVESLLEIAGGFDTLKIDETWQRIVRNDETVRSLIAKGLDPASLNDVQIQQLSQPLANPGILDTAMQKAGMLDKIVAEVAESAGRLVDLPEIASLAIAGAKSGGHQWPPIISLSEAGGYSFAVGSATLTPQFRDKIKGLVIERLLETARQYDVDIIEVVGHTDEQPIGSRASNLDLELTKVIQGRSPIENLIPGDNAGLGLARAVSVVSLLNSDGRLSNLSILPLSGAQLIQVNETLISRQDGANAKDRRRIEIRLRKSNERNR